MDTMKGETMKGRLLLPKGTNLDEGLESRERRGVIHPFFHPFAQSKGGLIAEEKVII